MRRKMRLYQWKDDRSEVANRDSYWDTGQVLRLQKGISPHFVVVGNPDVDKYVYWIHTGGDCGESHVSISVWALD